MIKAPAVQIVVSIRSSAHQDKAGIERDNSPSFDQVVGALDEESMKTSSILIAACVLAAISSVRAQAAERVFECPRISPVDGQTPLAFVKVLHDGEDEWGFPDADVTRRRRGVVYRMNDFAASNFTKARMECIYAVNRRPPRHSAFLDMPGLLLRCESEGPELPPDWNNWYGRYWCTTRIDGTPPR